MGTNKRGTITAVVSRRVRPRTSTRPRPATPDSGPSDGTDAAPYPQCVFVVKMKGDFLQNVAPDARSGMANGYPAKERSEVAEGGGAAFADTGWKRRAP